MKNAALYDDPKLYDLIVPLRPCEAFYRGIAARTGVPVLELVCGTGRLTLSVAADGHEVFGVEASTAMLDRATDKAAAADPDVKFVPRDIRTIELDQVFAVVIVSCNSLAHLTTNEDLAAGLATIERHLDPGGVFAFDFVNPGVRVFARSEAERVRLDLGPNPSAALAVEEVAAYDPIQQIRVSGLRVRDPIIGDRELAALRLRLIFPQELPLH